MSARLPLHVAAEAARDLQALLEPACRRIAIAGSIRRQVQMVKDMELVAVPRLDTEDGGDLWGTPVEVDRLNQRVDELLYSGDLTIRAVEIHRADGTLESGRRMGDNYKALVFRGVPVDLFIVRPPADWGVIFAIRTGPGDWNQRIVTDCQRFLRRVEKGRVYHSGQYVPCPEEADFFRAIGQAWVEPEQRFVGRVHIEARPAA